MIRFARILIIALVVIGTSSPTHAAGKKRPGTPQAGAPKSKIGRRALLVMPTSGVQIQLPDDTIRDFGVNFDGAVGQFLTNHPSLLLVRPESSRLSAKSAGSFKLIEAANGDPEWNGSVVPAATIRFHVDAMNLVTGYKGGRMFYGFDERFRTEFNDGTQSVINEFPLQIPFNYPNWFDRHFDVKGPWPFDSASGLDLGEGFRIDSLFAYLNVKYATYRSRVDLRIEVDAPLAGRHDFHKVQVRGSGYFYDVVGGYLQWQGGVGIARNKAMFEAFNRAVAEAVKAIDRAASGLPLAARVDFIQPDGAILIGTGFDAQVPVGTIYRGVENKNIFVKVEKSYLSGSLTRLVGGLPDEVRPGMNLIQVEKHPVEGSRVLAKVSEQKNLPQGTTELIQLPAQNLSEPDLRGSVDRISRVKAFLKSLIEGVFLPYRIWRFEQYDQPFAKSAKFSDEEDRLYDRTKSIQSTEDWNREVLNEKWARDYDTLRRQMTSQPVVIAIIDTGIDYNHPVIHDRLWLNPSPVVDSAGQRDRYGWDFISGDSRPYDDAYHGTQLAGAVLAIAARAQIMPIKVFNPWGVTNSAAILSAFTYAVDRGAKYILCGWATRRYSKAMELGVRYARDHGVPVIAAAGDLGLDLARVPAYPAAFARNYSNVIVVTARDEAGKRWKNSNFYTGVELAGRQVSAPGTGVLVPEPRGRYSHSSSTAVSAALYAGILATEPTPAQE